MQERLGKQYTVYYNRCKRVKIANKIIKTYLYFEYIRIVNVYVIDNLKSIAYY